MSDEHRINRIHGGRIDPGYCVNCLKPSTGVTIVSEPSHGPDGRFRAWTAYSHCDGCGRQLELAAYEQQDMTQVDVSIKPSSTYYDHAYPDPMIQRASAERVTSVLTKRQDVQWVPTDITLGMTMARGQAERQVERQAQTIRELSDELDKLRAAEAERMRAEAERMRQEEERKRDDRDDRGRGGR